MKKSGLKYYGTDIEVELGDRVIVKRLFKSLKGIVAYIPGLSEKRDDVEVCGQKNWLIRMERGDFLSTLYLPEHPRAQPKKNIIFIERGNEGIVTKDEDLGEP